MAIYSIKTIEQAKAALPVLEKFFVGYSEMFNCKITWEMGAFNETLSEKLTSQAK